MSLWRRSEGAPTANSPNSSAADLSPEGAGPEADVVPGVEGERGLPPAKTFRSVQSRVSSVLTVGLMTVLAGGLLIYYYTSALSRGSKLREAAKVQQQRRAQGESTLPPLSAFHMPQIVPAANADATTRDAPKRADPPPPSPIDQILGSAPPPAGNAQELPLATSNPYALGPNGAIGVNGEAPTRPKSPAQLALDRKLSGPVLTRTADQSPFSSTPGSLEEAGAPGLFGGPSAVRPGPAEPPRDEGPRVFTLDSLLKGTVTPAVAARVLPTQRFLLPQGAFIDCTLETAISSSLPGMTTCITATDTYSADGSVVLLERGTKLVGETQGTVQAGSPRLFVLWNQARTPAGIVVPLASPGTDELGRSGLSGTIDWHWWQRFGSALLISVIDGAVRAAADRSNTTSVQLNPTGASDVISNVLRSTANIPPTVNKAQGDRIEILVARDVDFRTVYTLRDRPAGAH